VVADGELFLPLPLATDVKEEGRHGRTGKRKNFAGDPSILSVPPAENGH